VSPNIRPTVRRGHAHGVVGQATCESAFEQLKEQLPTVLDLGELVQGLKGAFEGIWPHLYINSKHLVVTNPTFTPRGDLLLDVHPREQAHQSSLPRTPVQPAEESFFRQSDSLSSTLSTSTLRSPPRQHYSIGKTQSVIPRFNGRSPYSKQNLFADRSPLLAAAEIDDGL